ncbi:hypothetical protein SCAR479_05684 [Seiridium cardinale]|uniref:Uncharacterized protein n=1 Tax=Seiridium cardinale TaxID=138064 RepID=A0ABR2XV28_9PEZI
MRPVITSPAVRTPPPASTPPGLSHTISPAVGTLGTPPAALALGKREAGRQGGRKFTAPEIAKTPQSISC